MQQESLKAQLKIRQQQEQVTDYVDDIRRWQNDLKSEADSGNQNVNGIKDVFFFTLLFSAVYSFMNLSFWSPCIALIYT